MAHFFRLVDTPFDGLNYLSSIRQYKLFFFILDSVCVTVGSVVASDTREPGSNPVVGNFLRKFIYC